MKKIKILHILHELHPSGAEMMIKNAYPYWKDRCECTIMATGKQIGPFAEVLKETGYEIAFVPTVGCGKLSKIRHILDFYKYMRENHYDVVHIHRESLSFEYALIAKTTGSPNIVRTVHSTFAHQGIQRRIKSTTRRWMKQYLRTYFVAISDGVAQNEQMVFDNKCDEIIYNWCDNTRFQFVSPDLKRQLKESEDCADKMVVLTVGNCNHVKHHDLLIEAIGKMKQRDKIKYLHVGQSEETCKEEQMAQTMGVDDVIQFVGSTDPMPYLQQADIFVMTSRYEGLSIATLEAIFTGMRVMLAESPGLVEFKDKNLCNVLYFEAKPDALAKKLDEAVEEYESGRIQPMFDQCVRAEELYDIKKQAIKYQKIYEEIVE